LLLAELPPTPKKKKERTGLLVTCFSSICAAALLWMFVRYAILEQRTRDVWKRTELRPLVPPEGYRENQLPSFRELVVREQAPPVVRFAAASAQLFGITFVPGLLLAVVGVMFYGIGLLGIPGLIVAFSQFPVATALLRRTPDAAVRARKLARLSTGLNMVILLGGGAVLVPLVAGECISGANETAAMDLVPTLLPLIGWACLSLAQAALLRAAADAVESDLRVE
jgi:hypothetical protein